MQTTLPMRRDLRLLRASFRSVWSERPRCAGLNSHAALVFVRKPSSSIGYTGIIQFYAVSPFSWFYFLRLYQYMYIYAA